MSAPVEVLFQGINQSYLTVTDEPIDTPVVKVKKLSRKPNRDEVEVKNTNEVVVRVKFPNPTLELDFEGQLNGSSGLATTAPGTAVNTVDNFITGYRDFDKSAGSHYLRGIEDSIENLNDAPMTKFSVKHYPYVILD